MEFPWINAVLAAVPVGYVSKSDAPEEREKVIGEVPAGDLRRLHEAYCHLFDTAREKIEAHDKAVHLHGGEERTAMQGEIEILGSRGEALRDLFFESLQTELNLPGRRNIGIREGWKVVTWEDKPAPRPSGIVVIGTIFASPDAEKGSGPPSKEQLARNIREMFGV